MENVCFLFHSLRQPVIPLGREIPLFQTSREFARHSGVALATFGLALIAHDGLVALIAFAVSVGTASAMAYYLL